MNIHYIRAEDYFIPDLTLSEETRPIGKLWTYLADLNQQAQDRLERMIHQMKVAEGVTEELKAADLMAWVGAMNNIRARAEEVVREELIYE